MKAQLRIGHRPRLDRLAMLQKEPGLSPKFNRAHGKLIWGIYLS